MPSPSADEALLALAATVKHADPGATLTGWAPILEEGFLAPQADPALTIPTLPHFVLALLISSRFVWRARLRAEISRRALGLVMILPAAGLAHRALA
jgi:hypothetical protein